MHVAAVVEMTVIDIEFADHLVLYKHWSDDFGLGFERACEVPGIRVHVVHNNCHANYGTTNADEITEMLIEADELRRTMYRERLVLR